MSNKKTVLILTSGGLAPALNATLYGAIKKARSLNYKILGGINGWISLVQHGNIIDLTNLNIESIKKRGGNFLRSSRTNPFKVKNGIHILKENIKKYKIDGIIAIGGDDTLGAAAKLYKKEKISIIGLPKTIDNDLPATYFSPGFPSAAYYAAKLTAETKEDSAYTLNRVFIIEMYGANAGFLTCATALGNADIVIPPEWQFKLANILKLVKKKYEANGNYCVIGLSREANIKGIKGIVDKQPDGFNKVRQELISLTLGEKIQNKLGLSTKIILPVNYLQSGDPIKLDREMGYKLGQKGIELIKNEKFGYSAMIEYKNKKFNIKETPLNNFLKPVKKMPTSFFNKKEMLPTKNYYNYLKTLVNITKFTDKNYQKLQKKISSK